MVSYSTPVSIFSHSARIEIIKALINSPHTVTDLTEIIDLSMPEISRHLSKLSEHGFVDKSAITRKYEITNFGRTALQLYRPLDFMFSHSDFFQTHDISALPSSLKASIDQLSDAQYIQGTGFVMMKMREMVEQTDRIFQVMVDQPFPFGKENIDVEYILPQIFLNQNKGLKPENLGKTAFRIHPTIPIAMSIRDHEEALIHFSKSDGTLDYSTGFHFTSDMDISYGERIWSYYWDSGKLMTY